MLWPYDRDRVGSTVLSVLMIVLLVVRPSVCNTGILSSSLDTFQEASCEGESMTMTCPANMLVSIQFAQYGRQVPSTEMCPDPSIQADDPGYAIRLRSQALWEDTNCLATTSLKVILEQCQDKQKCHLVASTKTFQQDPCPGTRKYLEVAYKCRPNQFSSMTVCEGDQLELRCNKSTRIAISTGMFGRTATGDPMCPELLRNTSSLQTTCQSKDVVAILMKQCLGRKRCTIAAEEYMFGNPCPKGVNKYLNVLYTCVPKRVLKPRHRHHRKHHKNRGEGITSTDTSNNNIPADRSTPYNKNHSHITEEPSHSENEKFPADAANLEPSNSYDTQQHPSDPSIGQSKDSHGNKADIKINIKSDKTTECINGSKTYNGPSATGLLSDWLNAFNFIRRNREKAILYLVLGVAFGVISLLFLVIIRLAIVNKRRSRAKLDITEPTHEDTPIPTNHNDAPTLSRTDSVDRIEVVRFNPMRSRDFATCTLRSDIGNRSLTNYYG